MKKRFISLILSVLMVLTFVGCGNTTSDEGETLTVSNTNDYLGGCNRAEEIQTKIFDLTKSFQKKDNEYESLNNYWEDAQYFYLNFNPIDFSALEHTYYYNEEQCLWDETVNYNLESWGDEKAQEGISYNHEGKHKYSMYVKETEEHQPYFNEDTVRFSKKVVSEYVPDKDWLNTIVYSELYKNNIQTDMFEYARIENGAVFQTKNERCLVYFKDEWEEITMPVIKTREIKTVNEKGKEIVTYEQYIEEIPMEHYLGRGISELYYSKLVEDTRPKYADEKWDYLNSIFDREDYTLQSNIYTAESFLDELEDLETNHQVLTKDGSEVNYISMYYNENESLFPVIDKINKDWVISDDEVYEQTVIYQNGNIELGFANNLSKKTSKVLIDKEGHMKFSEIETPYVNEHTMEDFYQLVADKKEQQRREDNEKYGK